MYRLQRTWTTCSFLSEEWTIRSPLAVKMSDRAYVRVKQFSMTEALCLVTTEWLMVTELWYGSLKQWLRTCFKSVKKLFTLLAPCCKSGVFSKSSCLSQSASEQSLGLHKSRTVQFKSIRRVWQPTGQFIYYNVTETPTSFNRKRALFS